MENLDGNYMNTPSKGLVTDLDASLISKDFWTHARNSNLNTHQGNINFLTNEPSNKLCVNLPYTCIGYVKLIGGRYALFLTDNLNSEIGIFDTNYCTYTTLVNSPCLAFNTHNLIDASSKENFDCSESIYWTDGVNPRRYLNISAIPYTYTEADDACLTKTYTNKLDCDEILMTPKYQVPTITTALGAGGELTNGSYQVGMAYTINNQRVTDYHATTIPQEIFSHFNLGQSLVVDITNLDQNFSQFVLFVIYTVQNFTQAKIVGYFSTSQSQFEIVNINRPEYQTIPISEITTLRPQYLKADHVVNNDQYLLWAGTSTRPDLNYQQQAMQITAQWVMYQVPFDYYLNGGQNVGYMRGERYAFGIQWLFNTGEWSSAFHIPGRVSTGNELSQATGNDVYETLTPVNGVVTPVKVFEVYDTSKKTNVFNIGSNTTGAIVEQGNMGYWESVDKYPDNTIMFGADACMPIRHHQFPRECVAPRYANSGLSINILGVQFSNIEQPKDDKGNYLNTVVGYRIVRGDRSGNKSIIAKGLFSNVRSYQETLNQGGTQELVLYPNYPFNDLGEDRFISSTQTYNSQGEKGYSALTDVLTDQYNFYSPQTLFSNVALGEQVIFESEEVGAVKGYFENVWNHPRARVLNNSAFWLAVIIGAIDGVLSVLGKKCVVGLKDGLVSIQQISEPPAEIVIEAAGMKFLQDCEGLVNGLSFQDILALPAAEAVAKTALKILQTAASAGMAVYFAFNTAQSLLSDMEALMPFEKYALQYDAHGFFDSNKCVKQDNTRRQLTYYQYLYNGLNTVQGVKFNNFKRESSVYLKLNSTVVTPDTADTTRQTLGTSGQCNSPFSTFNSVSSMYYGMISNKIPDQYGQIDSITYQDTGYLSENLTTTSAIGTTTQIYSSGPIFGGDTYINRFAFNKKHQFFRQNIANSNFPDGFEFDYSQYRNVGFPRYWLNTEKYDISEVLVVGENPGRLPSNKYNFDCFSAPGSLEVFNASGIGGYFYLYNSGTSEFFVESEYNLDYRDWNLDYQNFYSRTQTNLSEIYRSDRIDTAEQFIYDRSLSKQLVENSITQQRIDYNPTIDETCFSYYKNRTIYSLPASMDLKSDNWLTYLTNNYYDFPLSDFGAITGMHAVDNQQILFTFDKSAPYITIGRDELQTVGGVKVTIGDAGLFAREPRPLVYTDFWYGNSQSRWAFVNTQFGSIYPSQRQGRIFNWSGQLAEISRNGMHWWFKNYLPSMLLTQFPNFVDYDNPVIGVGLTSGWDNTDEKYYLSKRDYRLMDQFVTSNTVIYQTTGTNPGFKLTDGHGNILDSITLGDPFYFEDASWTISYSPKDQMFVSWHDWQPDWILQAENHFFTILDNSIWTHNSRCDSFCNFYFVDYPWEIEYLVNNGPNVEILRNIEYTLETGIYYDDCRYFHQVLDGNFDNLVVYNLEQSSGNLNMVLQPREKMSRLLDYPQLAPIGQGVGWQVPYNKVEQKTRVNTFWDLTFNRGEFAPFNNFPLWTIAPNGYVKTVTDAAININKNPFERKKFRNYWHKIFLSKLSSGNKKYLFKFSNANTTQSPR